MSHPESGVAQPQDPAKRAGSLVPLIVGLLAVVVVGGAAAWWFRPVPRETPLVYVPADSQLVGVVQLRTLTEEIPALQRMMAQLYFSGGVSWKGEYGVAGRDLFDEAAVGGRFDSEQPQLTIVTRSRAPIQRELAMNRVHAGFAKPASPNSAMFQREGKNKLIGSVFLPDSRNIVFSTGTEPHPAALTSANRNHSAAGTLGTPSLESPLWLALALDDSTRKWLKPFVPEGLANALAPGRRIAVWVTPNGDRLELNCAVESPDSASAKKLLDGVNAAKTQSLADLDALAGSRPDLKSMLDEFKNSMQLETSDAQMRLKASASIASVETALNEIAKHLKIKIPSADSMFETPDGLMPRPTLQRSGG